MKRIFIIGLLLCFCMAGVSQKVRYSVYLNVQDIDLYFYHDKQTYVLWSTDPKTYENIHVCYYHSIEILNVIPVIWSKGKFMHKGDTLVCMDSDKKKEIRFLKQKNKLLCISHTGFSLKDSPSNKRKIFVSEVPQPVDAYSDEGDVVYSIKEVCVAELLQKVPLFRNHLYAMEDSLKLTLWLPNDSIKAVNTPFRNLDFIPYRILPILWEGDSPSRR